MTAALVCQRLASCQRKDDRVEVTVRQVPACLADHKMCAQQLSVSGYCAGTVEFVSLALRCHADCYL